MRGIWLVAGGLGLLLAAYAMDRWLQELLVNVGTYAGGEGWRELALAIALVPRLVVLAGLAAIFLAVREGKAPWASAALVAIGALVGIGAPLLLGLHVALQPDGLPFVSLNRETAPVWDGRAVFVPWTAVGLFVVGIAGLLASRGVTLARSMSPKVIAIGAALMFAATYPLDALFEAVAIELSSGFDAYPAYLLLGLVMRLAVMVAFVALLASAVRSAPNRMVGVALLLVGMVGFAVLPLLALLTPAFPLPGEQSLTNVLDPGTAGRWMAAATVIVGAIDLLRPGLNAPEGEPDPRIAPSHDLA